MFAAHAHQQTNNQQITLTACMVDTVDSIHCTSLIALLSLALVSVDSSQEAFLNETTVCYRTGKLVTKAQFLCCYSEKGIVVVVYTIAAPTQHCSRDTARYAAAAAS
jgi:hypothetical protein